MRAPAVWMAGHLTGTHSGTIWATWQLSPLAYGHRGADAKKEARMWHRALMRSLLGESLLLGVAASVDPVSVVGRMLTGVPLDRCPEWAAECEATLDTLETLPLGQRSFFLSVPLRETTATAALTAASRSAVTTFTDLLALPRRAIPPGAVEHYLAQARDVQQAIPAPFAPRPASAAQMTWLFLHTQERGLYSDLDLPPAAATSPDGDVVAALQSAAALGDPLLDVAGKTDFPPRTSLRDWNPLRRRFVKVIPSHAPDTASYQALMALAGLPADGMMFPGSEFLGRIDESGLDVDWAVRSTVRCRDEVAGRNRRALRQMNDQYGQLDGELATGPHELDRAARDLAEYQAVLAADENEVEVQPSIIFAVGDPTAAGVLDKARDLASYLTRSNYTINWPAGSHQQTLWWAMQPGTSTSRVVRQFAQITTSHNFAAAVPLASTELGDNSGPLLALNISTGLPSPVHHDVAGAATNLNASGSIAVCGELGAGKSFTLKKIIQDAVDRGGRFVALDRTETGEWVTMARSLPASTIIDVLAPAVSLDPLRTFGRQIGGRITQSFLTPLLNITPTSPLGMLLADILDPAYLDIHGITGLGDLLAYLADDCDLPAAAELHRMINVYARKDFGRVIFDPSLPPLSLHDRAIVVHTHGLELPNRDDLVHAHLFAQLALEKVFGRALYALAGAVGRQVCFSDRSDLAAFVTDEAHHLTASPQGERELIEFVRDGRKHQAAAVIGTHDPEDDLPSAVLRGLIPTRILMRHTDRELAQRGLRWIEPTLADDDDMIRMITEDTSPVIGNEVPEHRRGEGLMRDPRGRIGRIKVLPPARPERLAAVSTTPPIARAGGAGV